MNKVQLTRATLLAAALVAAAPSPAEAQDRRPSQLLKILMLLKGAPTQRLAKASETRTADAGARPTRPTVARPARPALLAARGDDDPALPALPVSADPSPLPR